MFTPRTRFTLRKLSDDVLVMKTNPARRLLFFAMAVLLFVAFLTGYGGDSDLSGGRLGGTIFYAALFLVCAGVSAWETRYIFDSEDCAMRSERRLIGFRLTGAEVSLPDGSAVVMQQVHLIKEGEQPHGRGILGTRLRGYTARRSSIGKLMVETPEKQHFLDDSSNLEELANIGQAIARFLDIGYRKEDL